MDLWTYLKNTNKPIVLYGMGNGADRIISILQEIGVKVQGVFASDDFVRYQQFHGFTVCRYLELKERFNEIIVLISFGTQRPEVLENIKQIAKEQEVYAPDVPVAGEEIFNSTFLERHYKELETVYQLLEDDQSRLVFKNVVESKLTGKIQPLFECESNPSEAFERLDLSENEVFLDLGAYNGDTVNEFIQYTKGRYERIIALEPDVKNYKKLLENTKHLNHIECINACVGEESGERMFAMDGGRKSKALDYNGIAIPCKTIDEISNGERISYIKLDVEGMETAALQGGEETIRRWKPKMLVSAYHRSEDLFHLPLLVREIAPDVKIYLRHFSYLPAWDTNFYFKF